MSNIKNYLDKIRPQFEDGGKLKPLRSVFEGFESFLLVPSATSKSGVSTHEAIQDPANQLTDKPELGLQLWLRTTAVNGAAWLNWRQFIFQGDTIPERFTAGLTLTLSPASETKVAFKMPFALILSKNPFGSGNLLWFQLNV